MVKKLESIDVSQMSSLSVDEATQLIGQTISGVKATEYGLVLSFASGAVLEVQGATYSDSALSVDFEAAAASTDVLQIAVPGSASIDWVSNQESNTPRAKIQKLAKTAKTIVVEFQGSESGQDAVWGGSVNLTRTTEPQTLTGRYQVKPGPRMKDTVQVVQYILSGRFEDETFTSFTGCWREGEGFATMYEFHLDL